MASSRRGAVCSVPDTGSRRPMGSIWTPSDRGKNSYQEPYSARSPLHQQRQPPGPGHQLAQRVGGQHPGHLGVPGRGQPVPRGQPRVPQHLGHRGQRGPDHIRGQRLVDHRLARGGLRQPHPGRPDDRLGRLVEQERALGHDQLDVLAAGHLDAGVVVPVGDRVGPGLDPERPVARGGWPPRPCPTGRSPGPARASSPAAGCCHRGRAAPPRRPRRRALRGTRPRSPGTARRPPTWPGTARSPPRAARQGWGFVRSRWSRYRACWQPCQCGTRPAP